MLDQLAQPHDETVCPAVLDDAAHDLPIIQVFVVVLKMGVEQLVQNVAAAAGQALPHMVAGVLGGHQTADVDEPQKGFGIPLIQCVLAGAACFQLGQFFVGIIDQSGQLRAGGLGHALAQDQIHLFPDDAGRRIQDVHECFVFAVQVAHKMFRSLGQLEQCLGADDLAGRGRLGRIIPRKQGQIFQIVADLIVFGAHEVPPEDKVF